MYCKDDLVFGFECIMHLRVVKTTLFFIFFQNIV